MKISIRGKNIEITDAIANVVEEKLSVLDKYFIMSEAVQAKVLVRTYPHVGQKIEVTIPTEYVLLRAEDVNEDLYAAIDLVVDKLEGQIRKYKTKLSRKSKNNKLAFNVASLEELEDSDEEDVIVKVKQILPKPMDMEEAIMQLELIDHDFYVYIDRETERTSVVYRRHNGGYGLLETTEQ
ncbi:MAG: ribosome-associated translation inhibitor RaiA [Erysipelotrichaceae bacterium]|nr:ribosome-associated translation inhibitor RaiA [Erysipelotrichaceae bacterium]